MRTIEEIDKEWKEVCDKLDELRAERKEVEFSDLPKMINKFWKITTAFGEEIYTHVYSFFRSGGDYIIRGSGFSWENTPYWDACDMYWSWGRDITIRPHDFDHYFKKEGNIVEISKEEYLQKYKEMIDVMSKKFYEVAEIDYDEDE